MGSQTPEKKTYDQWAVDYFEACGWQAFVVEKPGSFADVLASDDDRLAIVEVKSNKERSADWNWDDTKGLGSVHPSVEEYLKTARREVVSKFPPRRFTLRKLYAVTVAAQLYRYYHELEAKLETYETCAPVGVTLRGREKVPYLVVPSADAEELRLAMEVLLRERFVSSFSIDTAKKIAVVKVAFP